MKHLITILTVCLYSILASLAFAQTAPVITILHTNDTHSQIEPRFDRTIDTLCGGVVERAAMLEYYRTQDPDLLYLDAGDMVQGSPYFNIFKGELEMLCMNQMGLLATTFGNHEFDNGVSGIASMLRIADFPIICCNFHCEGTEIAERVLPHLIVTRHGVKIGITGITCDPMGLIAARHWKGLTYEEPVEAVNREARLLREEGCDLVIVLSHVGYIATPTNERDRHLDPYIASLSHDIDLIIGAHTHVNIEHGVTVANADGHPVLITQTGGKANPMGYLQVTMKPGSRYAACQYSVDSIQCRKLHSRDHDLTAYGHEMAELVAPYREALQGQMNLPLAQAPERLDKRHTQSTLGNFTADALRLIAQQATGRSIDVSVTNVGGLRSDIEAGDVTVGSIYKVFPFENTIVVLDLRGSDLAALIQSNAGRKLDCWSGTQITLAMDGDRCYASDIRIGGQPIDPERIYTLCTIDYLAEGNSGMTALTRAVATQTTGLTIRDAMIDYVRALGEAGQPVAASLDDRVIDHTRDSSH